MSDTTKKIVINTCFGGFSLSEKAFGMYLDRKGIEYEIERRPDFVWSVRFKMKHEEDSYLDEHDVNRDDPILISVIEELGTEESAGKYSSLKIVEIPSDVDCWTIYDYDGLELVHECHRVWGGFD